MENRKGKLFTIIITALVTCFLTTAVNGFIDSLTRSEAMEKISLVKKMLLEYSLFDLDEEMIADYASVGMAASVGDPYTVYYPKEEFSSYKTNIFSSYVGVGAVLSANMEEDVIEIVSTVKDGPADKAGLKAGDKILDIDGKHYGAEQLTEASTHLKNGDEGTDVKVTVLRKDEGQLELNITREKVIKKSVESKMLENDIGYIKISGFEGKLDNATKDTYDEFMENFSGLKSAGIKNLIIDLRDNPGGDLNVVCNIADELLPKGIITYTEDKYGKRETIYSDKDEVDIPIVVLVNEGSASASEVLTGALKDYKKATVVGTKTYGKGIVQNVFPFPDGSGMSITTAKYFTPNGECIHGVGITPDIVVEAESEDLSNSENDNQLQKAIDIIKK